jgi:hypothetical protein
MRRCTLLVRQRREHRTYGLTGRQHRFARLSQMQPLGEPIDEQVEHPMFAEIATRNGLIIRP